MNYQLEYLKNSGWHILVHTDGHSKFWAFLFDGGRARIRWGKIGTVGVEQEAEGFDYVIHKVNEKLNKGYRWATNPQDSALIPESIKVLWEM